MNGEQDVHILMSPRKKNVMSPRTKCTFSCPRGKCASRCATCTHVMLVQMPARFSLLYMLQESHRFFFPPRFHSCTCFQGQFFFSCFPCCTCCKTTKKGDDDTKEDTFVFPTVSPFAAHVASINKKRLMMTKRMMLDGSSA